MSIVAKKEQNTKPTAGRRRRKTRRTEDFSDSSSDSSSSDSSDEEDNKADDNKENVTAVDVDQDGDVVLNETDIFIDPEQGEQEEDFTKVKQKLKTVKLTKTALNSGSKNIDINQVESILQQNHKTLENDYLGLMFESYGDDINTLRTAPDFNERSLTILANALKNGSNIFDEDTLKAVVNNK